MRRRTFLTGGASLALGATAGCLNSLQESRGPWHINLYTLFNWTTEEQLFQILVQSGEDIVLWESRRVEGRTPDSDARMPEPASAGRRPDKQVKSGDVMVRLRVGERQSTTEIDVDDLSGQSLDLLFHYGQGQAQSSGDTVAEPYVTYTAQDWEQRS